MKLKIVFSRTVVTPVDCWPEFRNIEVEVPDYLRDTGADYGEWHVVGALPPEKEATQ